MVGSGKVIDRASIKDDANHRSSNRKSPGSTAAMTGEHKVIRNISSAIAMRWQPMLD